MSDQGEEPELGAEFRELDRKAVERQLIGSQIAATLGQWRAAREAGDDAEEKRLKEALEALYDQQAEL